MSKHVYSSSWVMVVTKKMRQIEGYWKLILLTDTLCVWKTWFSKPGHLNWRA